MIESEWLAGQFEQQRGHLRAVAYRMLGSLAEADDAVQEAWVRASRADGTAIENMRGWLTTIVARVSLNMLRARKSHAEESLEAHLPDPVVTSEGSSQPEEEALLADSVGLALLVVLDTLAPAERLAFVLHDVFKLPFDEIGAMVDRTPAAARQLASRARRRVKGAGEAAPDRDRQRQRQVVDAFFAAARAGDLEGLIALLDPAVVLRADFGKRRAPAPPVTRGQSSVATLALTGARLSNAELIPVLVNGSAGVVVMVAGRPFSMMGFIVAGGRIVEIDAIVDPGRIATIAGAAIRQASTPP